MALFWRVFSYEILFVKCFFLFKYILICHMYFNMYFNTLLCYFSVCTFFRYPHPSPCPDPEWLMPSNQSLDYCAAASNLAWIHLRGSCSYSISGWSQGRRWRSITNEASWLVLFGDWWMQIKQLAVECLWRQRCWTKCNNEAENHLTSGC